tara:strand:+ start:1102 stop:1587 length:486 start_codon:yes stop_codon:yes gene_type:complete
VDHIDQILAQWQRERPELDAWPMAPIGRMYRLFNYLAGDIEAVHKQGGLTTGEFDVLATLRRSGAPFRLTPTSLFQTAMLSSGAMTNRLNQLEKRGLITRLPAEDDRRSLLVQLTDTGRELIDNMVEAHLEKERELLSALSGKEQETLNQIFKKWLRAFEE